MAFEVFGRHWTVWRAAWQAESQGVGDPSGAA